MRSLILPLLSFPTAPHHLTSPSCLKTTQTERRSNFSLGNLHHHLAHDWHEIMRFFPCIFRVYDLKVKRPHQLYHVCQYQQFHITQRERKREKGLTSKVTLLNSNIATVFPEHVHLPLPKTPSNALRLISLVRSSHSVNLSGRKTSTFPPKIFSFFASATELWPTRIPGGRNTPLTVSPCGGTTL